MMKNLLKTSAVLCFVVAAACPNVSAMNVQIRDGRPVVDRVYVNGQGPYKLLLDTGSTLNHLDLRLAKKIGLKETIHTTLTSATGVVRASGGTGIDVALDSVHEDNQTFLFAGLDAVQQTWPDVMGILGQEFLSHFDYTLDLRTKRLEFGKPEDSNGTRVPLSVVNGRLAVSTSLGELILDSGAARLTLFGVDGDTDLGGKRELRTVTGSQEVGMVFIKSLVVQGQTIW